MREGPWREQARGLVFLPASAPQVGLQVALCCNFEVSIAVLIHVGRRVHLRMDKDCARAPRPRETVCVHAWSNIMRFT